MLNLHNFSWNELEQLAAFLTSIDRNDESNVVLDYLANDLAKGNEEYVLDSI